MSFNPPRADSTTPDASADPMSFPFCSANTTGYGGMRIPEIQTPPRMREWIKRQSRAGRGRQGWAEVLPLVSGFSRPCGPTTCDVCTRVSHLPAHLSCRTHADEKHDGQHEERGLRPHTIVNAVGASKMEKPELVKQK